jgi:hypothetical protein
LFTHSFRLQSGVEHLKPRTFFLCHFV